VRASSLPAVLTSSLLIASTFVLVACEAGTKPPASDTPSAVAPGLDVTDPLALVPGDSDLVMRIDFAALRKSPLWGTYEKDLLEFIAPSFPGCGYNPLAELSTVTLGIPMGSELGVFVFRGLDRDKTLHCLRTSKLDTKTTPTFDGDFVMLTNKSGNQNIIKFVDAKTMVMQGSKRPTKETLTRALAIGAPLRKDAAFVAAEKTLAPGAAFAMMSRPGSKAFAEGMRAKLGVPTRGFTATVHITDVVAVRAAIAMEKPEDAASVLANVKAQTEELKPYVDRYDVSAQGSTVTVDIALTEAQIKVFTDMAKALMGGMGG
jgi:hypothetical protein